MPAPRVVEATFIKSAQSIADSLPEDMSEVVFLGRSNVGKSSTLNGLTQRKNLAKSSATPGKTQLINFFETRYLYNEQSYPVRFVDLPGFGYAKVSKSIKSDWEKNLTDFIADRKQIKVFLHLIDCRHPDLEIDHSVANYLDQVCREDQVIVRVFTKIDKLNQKEQGKLLRDYPGAILVSSAKKRGTNKLVALIHELLTQEQIVIEDDDEA